MDCGKLLYLEEQSSMITVDAEGHQTNQCDPVSNWLQYTI